MDVIPRDYIPEEDEAYIFSSWRNSSYYSALQKPKGLPETFFSKQSQKIANILKNAKVRIACLDESPKTIIGYSVSTGKHLDWIYVKSDYRKVGIGKILMPKDIETFTDQLTKIGDAIVKKKNLKIIGE